MIKGTPRLSWRVWVRRVGWRVYGTNQPVESLALEQAVLAYRK